MFALRIYDNGGKSIDRYFVIFSDGTGVGLSANPNSPQGFAQHSDYVEGAHLGTLIDETDLPEECQEWINNYVAKEYTIPVAWQMYGKVKVKAGSLEDAISIAEGTDTPLPEGSYIEDSFEIDHDALRDEYPDEI